MVGLDAREDLRLFGGGDFFFFHFAVEILADRLDAAIEEARFHVAKNHVVAGARKYVRDAIAHGAGAQHRDSFNFINGH